MAESGVERFSCRRCGGEVDAGDRFCPVCGVNLTGQVHRALPGGRRCPACGAGCSVQAKFCNGCGGTLVRRSRSVWKIATGVAVPVIGFFVVAAMLGEPEAKNAAADQARVMEIVGTAVATPAPMTEEWKAAYPRIEDAREIATRPWSRIGEQLSFRGTIAWIEVARPGETVEMGDEGEFAYAAEIGVAVETPMGYEYLIVGYDLDTTGMFPGTIVRVYGELVDAESSEDYGAAYLLPVVEGDLVEIDPFDGLPPSTVG